MSDTRRFLLFAMSGKEINRHIDASVAEQSAGSLAVFLITKDPKYRDHLRGIGPANIAYLGRVRVTKQPAEPSVDPVWSRPGLAESKRRISFW